MIAYMAVVKGYEQKNLNLHDTVYKIAKSEIPSNAYAHLVDSSSPYRRRMAANAEAFNAELSFYIVKPLYTGLAYFCYKTGLPLTKSTLVPSLIGYLLLGLFIFFWLTKYMQVILAFAGGLLIMFSAPFMGAVKLSSPDCLAALFVSLAFYCLLENKMLWKIYVFLLLSILTRIDNVLPCFFILSALAFTNKWKYKIPLSAFLFLLAGAAICYWLIPYTFPFYHISYSSFLTHLNPNYEIRQQFIFSDYIALAKSQLMTGVYFSHLAVYILLIVFLFIGRFPLKWQQMNFDELLSLLFLLIFIVRFLLQPVIPDRYYLPYYLCVLILVVRKLARVSAITV
jgi:hypothetical protein